MKVTEAFNNKREFEAACKAAEACRDELALLLQATTQQEFEAVILRNFSWCVKYKVLEEWLPSELPMCKVLNCNSCKGLTKLPELPTCEELRCYGCTGVTKLPELPMCKWLYCYDCKGLTKLPELPICEELYCDERLKERERTGDNLSPLQEDDETTRTD